jgi:hypothetical protein
MRCSTIFAGTLFSVAGAFAQQTGPTAASSNSVAPNIVPQEAFDGAVYRALKMPAIPPPGNRKPTLFAYNTRPPVTLMQGTPKVCAIPLLNVRPPGTSDKMPFAHADPGVDPKMVLTPRVPACPSVILRKP